MHVYDILSNFECTQAASHFAQMCFLDCALCLVLDPMFGSWKFEGNAREAN